jgi:hypothetical protein
LRILWNFLPIHGSSICLQISSLLDLGKTSEIIAYLKALSVELILLYT